MIQVYDFTPQQGEVISKVFEAVMQYHELDTHEISVEITLLNEEEMRSVNAQTRGIDNPTDVLSFPSFDIELPLDMKRYEKDISPETGELYIGEILICEQIMNEQAVEYGHSEERELAFLSVHGLLHLLGYDHISEDMRVEMRKAEEESLTRSGFTR